MSLNKIIAVIPVRMASSRFPGKPLEKLHGMPMVGHCYHRACLAEGIDEVYVATCDQEIVEYVVSVGGTAIMTSDQHTRATTRTAEALEHIEDLTGESVEIIVMMQGDEPLVKPETIAETVPHFEDPDVEIVNIMSRIRTYEQFVDKNNVKVVVASNHDALYFSREPIPSPWHGIEELPMFMQTGIIAFRRDALIRFNNMQESELEKIESIDMNRVLESGGKVRMVPTDTVTLGVDTKDELCVAESLMNSDSIMSMYLK